MQRAYRIKITVKYERSSRELIFFFSSSSLSLFLFFFIPYLTWKERSRTSWNASNPFLFIVRRFTDKTIMVAVLLGSRVRRKVWQFYERRKKRARSWLQSCKDCRICRSTTLVYREVSFLWRASSSRRSILPYVCVTVDTLCHFERIARCAISFLSFFFAFSFFFLPPPQLARVHSRPVYTIFVKRLTFRER